MIYVGSTAFLASVSKLNPQYGHKLASSGASFPHPGHFFLGLGSLTIFVIAFSTFFSLRSILAKAAGTRRDINGPPIKNTTAKNVANGPVKKK